jgi:hypothetical protein
MTEREAIKLALEALEYIHEGANNQGPHTGISWRCVSNKAEPVITALRERLAQPEPGTWREVTYDQLMEEVRNRGYEIRNAKIVAPQPKQEPVCAHGVKKTKCDFCKQPAQPSKPWVGLTDEERDYIWYTVGNSDAHGDVDGWSGRAVMDAIEAKLKEKNG